MDSADNKPGILWISKDKKFQFTFKHYFEKGRKQKQIDVDLTLFSNCGKQLKIWNKSEFTVNGDKLHFDKTINNYRIVGTLNAFENNYNVQNISIWGDFEFGMKNDKLFHFTGTLTDNSLQKDNTLNSENHKKQDDNTNIINSDAKTDISSEYIDPTSTDETYHDFFPFIYLSDWENTADEKKECVLVKYKPLAANHSTSKFIDKLIQFKKNNNRWAMEAEADTFIADNHIYWKEFIQNASCLNGEISKFPQLFERIKKLKSYDSIISRICEILNLNIFEACDYLKCKEYTSQKEKLWQSYFALIIRAGYRTKWLEEITSLLIACNLLEMLFFNLTASTDNTPLTDDKIKDLIDANILLPRNVFPLPPHANSPYVNYNKQDNNMHKLGNLQMGKQKLVGYETNKIAELKSFIPKEKEETYKSILGNSNPIIGSYYWLNKVYNACLVKNGNRLMLNFLVTNPAKKYAKTDINFKKNRLIEPKSPSALFKINSFKDISINNYAHICTYYGVDKLDLPPIETLMVSEILEGNESKFINIPNGYQATAAYISYISNPENSQYCVNGLVGRKKFKFLGTEGVSAFINLSKEKTPIPVSSSISCMHQPLPLTKKIFRIIIEIKCTCNAKIIIEWKKKLYFQIMAKYKAQKKEYYKMLHSNLHQNTYSNPPIGKKTIKEELKNYCINQLISTLKFMIGVPLYSSSTLKYDVTKSEILSFLNTSIEWDEMTFTLLESFGNDISFNKKEELNSNDDQTLNVFLNAKGIKVIVPVKPEHNNTMIYFLNTGLFWTEKDIAASKHQKNKILTTSIKTLCNNFSLLNNTSENRQFKVPVTMQT